MGSSSKAARRPGIELLAEAVRNSYTGGSLKSSVRALGLRQPAEITAMYLRGEHPDYLTTAVLVVNQGGE